MSSPHSTEPEPAAPGPRRRPPGATVPPLLLARESPIHGVGVFVTRAVQAGEVLEECPMMVLSPEDGDRVAETMLHGHVYDWGEHGEVAIALGNASLLNHSRSPNARYELLYEHRRLRLVALHPIASGAEVLVNYNGDPDCQDPVWFE